MMDKCPSCKEFLVFPRDNDRYCEDCGWPNEDFAEIYGYPNVGERLENYQPGLEFYDRGSERWMQSGVITATAKSWSKGLYRYRLKSPTPPQEQ